MADLKNLQNDPNFTPFITHDGRIIVSSHEPMTPLIAGSTLKVRGEKQTNAQKSRSWLRRGSRTR